MASILQKFKQSLFGTPQWAQEIIRAAKENNSTSLNLSPYANGYSTNEKLAKVPNEVFELSNLRELHLGGNQLTTVPEAITRLQNLTNLYLFDNPLISPPQEIAYQGIEAIRQYFQQLNQEGVDYLYEAKLLVLGGRRGRQDHLCQ